MHFPQFLSCKKMTFKDKIPSFFGLLNILNSSGDFITENAGNNYKINF